ncbi:MAG TPA: class I adenylate-forming enzyme family protein [Chloroflexia bacterium]|nr:class I adenylate-forming enzyme family protein [Chloroflexia bacterium]
MPSELLSELVREGKNSNPSRLALVWRDQELSYLALDGQIDQVACSLLNKGVQDGDRIALYMHNVPQFVVALYALQRLGAIPVPVSIYWKGSDLRYLLHRTAVSGVVTVAPLYERVKEVQPTLPDLKLVVVVGAGQPAQGFTAWDELTAEPFPDTVSSEQDAADPGLIAFTGGRSGPSHPVVLSHFNLLANCQQMQDMPLVQFLGDPEQEGLLEGSRVQRGASQNEVALLPLPLTNLFSLNIGLNLTMMLKGTAVLMERFYPAQALELVEQRQCTLIFGSPAVFTALVNAPEFKSAKLQSLRYAFSYGGPLPEEVRQAWSKQTNCPLFNCYGLTEAGPLLCCEAAGETLTRGSVGPVLPLVEIVLMGPNGPIQAYDQAGQVLAKGPNMMLGYFNPADPDNPDPARPEGWFYTSDMGMVNEQGHYQIIDRFEDILLLPAGEIIVPRDIERALCEHPGVWEAAALPYTTEDGRARMVAFVVLTEDAKRLTEPQLLHFCERKLPVALCPERIFVYKEEELPRLPNGAIWRRALRAQIQDYL